MYEITTYYLIYCNRSDVMELTQPYVFSILFIFLVLCACNKLQSSGGAMASAASSLDSPTGVTPGFITRTKLIQKIL